MAIFCPTCTNKPLGWLNNESQGILASDIQLLRARHPRGSRRIHPPLELDDDFFCVGRTVRQSKQRDSWARLCRTCRALDISVLRTPRTAGSHQPIPRQSIPMAGRLCMCANPRSRPENGCQALF